MWLDKFYDVAPPLDIPLVPSRNRSSTTSSHVARVPAVRPGAAVPSMSRCETAQGGASGTPSGLTAPGTLPEQRSLRLLKPAKTAECALFCPDRGMIAKRSMRTLRYGVSQASFGLRAFKADATLDSRSSVLSGIRNNLALIHGWSFADRCR